MTDSVDRRTTGEVAIPLSFDTRGRTATLGRAPHVADLVEAVLFTAPGERVNRPDFGSGLLQMVFAPNSPELAAAVQFTVQAALNRWLADLIEVGTLQATSDDASLSVELSYLVKATGQPRTATFTRSVP